jgi:prepilin-type N-terminal cleavage/methylation domain-containing protein
MSRRAEAGFSLIELVTVTAALSVLLLVVGASVDRVQRNFERQRLQLEALDNGRPALDLLVRLLRMAGHNPRGVAGVRGLDPDPDGNGAFDSIALQADWNPADGDFEDPYENVAFSVRGNALVKAELGDPPEGVVLATSVAALRFEYYDGGLGLLADAAAAPGSIRHAAVTLVLRADTPAAPPAVEIRSAATLRSRE